MATPTNVRITVNGRTHQVTVDPTTPLLWVLRDNLGLTGTKYGCGIGACGACTAHVNGYPVRTCSLPVKDAQDAEIMTVEGLSSNRSHPVQQAWIAEQVPQCGYCQSGQIMAAAALLNNTLEPTDEDIESAMTNICRCGAYSRIKRAVRRAAKDMKRRV